jgi:hypothetical protein
MHGVTWLGCDAKVVGAANHAQWVRGDCGAAIRVSLVACSFAARGGVETAVEALKSFGSARARGVLCGMGAMRFSVVCRGCDAEVVGAAHHAQWVRFHCVAATRVSLVAWSSAACGGVETAVEALKSFGSARARGVLGGMGAMRFSVVCRGCDAEVVGAAHHAQWVRFHCVAATRVSLVAWSSAARGGVETAVEALKSFINARARGVLCGMGAVLNSVVCRGCDAKVVGAASHIWVRGNRVAAI